MKVERFVSGPLASIGFLFLSHSTSASPCIPQDFNCDANVGFSELNFVLSHYGNFYPPADLNGDGNVNFYEMNSILTAWGPYDMDEPAALNVSLLPGANNESTGAAPIEIRRQTHFSFSSNVGGGVPPYEYKWYINNRRIQNGSNSVNSSGQQIYFKAKITEDGLLNLYDITGDDFNGEIKLRVTDSRNTTRLSSSPIEIDRSGWLQSLQLKASLDAENERLTLSWNQEGGSVAKAVGNNFEWQNIGSTNGSSFEIENLPWGTFQEYRVRNAGEIGVIKVGFNAQDPRQNNRGILLLVVEESLLQNAEFIGRFERLKKDLVVEGWEVKVRSVSSSLTSIQVRQQLRSIHQQTPLEAVFIIGQVAIPYSEGNPDGHGYRPIPALSFYGELSAPVSSSGSAETRWLRDLSQNDGNHFLNRWVPGTTDVQVGYVDFHGMPSQYGDPHELLLRYLDKDHAFRRGQWQQLIPRRGLYHDLGIQAFNVKRTFSGVFGPDNFFSSKTLLSLESDKAFLWAASYGLQAPSTLFWENGIKSVFTTYIRSHSMNWAGSHPLYQSLRGSLAAHGYGLGSIWSGNPEVFIHRSAPTGSVGEVVRDTLNNHEYALGENLPNEDGTVWYLSNTHLALMGDPSLRHYYRCGVEDLRVQREGANIRLSWRSCYDNQIQGYRIFSSENKDGPYQRIIPFDFNVNNLVISRPSRDTYYVVRPVYKIETDYAGIYYDVGSGDRVFYDR